MVMLPGMGSETKSLSSLSYQMLIFIGTALSVNSADTWQRGALLLIMELLSIVWLNQIHYSSGIFVKPSLLASHLGFSILNKEVT